MKLNFFNRKKEVVPQTMELQRPTQTTEFKGGRMIGVGLGDPYCPEQKGGYGYIYGPSNLYPQQLLTAYSTSPIHQSCVNFKTLNTSGNGVEVDMESFNLNQKISATQLLKQLNDSIEGLTNDFFIHSRFYFEIHWNTDFTKIIKIKYLPAETIRIYNVDNNFEPTEYIYCFDWKQPGRFGYKMFPKFNQSNKTNTIQLYEYQAATPGKKIYTLPTYRSALDWISLDGSMAIYHNANIQNSLNPSLIVKFFEIPDTEEKKESIRESLVDSFGGPEKTGRVMTFFSPDKDSAPEVTQLQPNLLDKTFLQLTDTVQRSICYAHSINADLLGLKTPSSLGNNAGQMAELKKQFVDSIIKPAKNKIETELNYLTSFNGVTGFKLN